MVGRGELTDRYLSEQHIPDPRAGATIGVAFLSLRLIYPHLAPLIKEGGWLLGLVEPQFEVGRGEVGRGGVVRDRAKHRRVILEVAESAQALGLTVAGLIASPLKGPKGNREFFLYAVKGAAAGLPALEAAVDAVVASCRQRLALYILSPQRSHYTGRPSSLPLVKL